jgi:hypothetical protein
MGWTPIQRARRWLGPERRSDLAPWLVVAVLAHVALILVLVGIPLATPSGTGARWSEPPLHPSAPRPPTGEPIDVELLTLAEAAPPSEGPGNPSADGAPPEGNLLASASRLPSGTRASRSPPFDRISREVARWREAASTATTGEAANAPSAPAGGIPGAVEAPGDAEPGQGSEQAPERAARHLSLQELGVGRGNNPFMGSAHELPTKRQLDSQRLRQSLRGELARRDQMRGLGPEGPAVQAVKDIVLASASAPNTSALLRVRTDAAGAVTLVEVLESDRDGDEWRRIADELVRALAGKRLRVPARSNGVSFQLRVVSRVQLPSGADPGLAVDLFGIPVKKGEGDRSAKLSVLTPTLQEVVIPGSDGQTMLVPTLAILGLAGDVSDIGRVARRLVTAYLVAMEADILPEAPAVNPPMKPAPHGHP